tara:strand:- start:209 stop:445 length:237 start_codon:yes stop_codon:yes gene_type:complete
MLSKDGAVMVKEHAHHGLTSMEMEKLTCFVMITLEDIGQCSAREMALLRMWEPISKDGAVIVDLNHTMLTSMEMARQI